jgi:hypothetical protein
LIVGSGAQRAPSVLVYKRPPLASLQTALPSREAMLPSRSPRRGRRSRLGWMVLSPPRDARLDPVRGAHPAPSACSPLPPRQSSLALEALSRAVANPRRGGGRRTARRISGLRETTPGGHGRQHEGGRAATDDNTKEAGQPQTVTPRRLGSCRTARLSSHGSRSSGMAERVASEAQDGGGEFPRNGAARARAQRRAPPGGADRGHLLERGRWPKGTRATSWFWPRDRIFFTTASSSFQQFPFAILKKTVSLCLVCTPTALPANEKNDFYKILQSCGY